MEKIEKIEDLIYEETEKRLKIMESKSYVFPEKIGKTDIFAIIFLIVISVFFTILCMIGVIN